jgi:hypothetical protein
MASSPGSAAEPTPTDGTPFVSTEQRENLDAILRQSAFPADLGVSEQVTVRELTGAERDRIYAEQARRYPGFAEYARQTAEVRTIPVLELRRA